MTYTLELLKENRDNLVVKREIYRNIMRTIDAAINQLSDDIFEIDRKTKELEVRQDDATS